MENFNKTYYKIFEGVPRTVCFRSHKSLFKKEYMKYLECGNIEQCKFKNQMYMFVRIIQLEEQSSLISSSSLDSISSGVST
tara:strand:+ start:273 stop:515 length:243 start_codon:yes stop_codon:yes gene_type:complete